MARREFVIRDTAQVYPEYALIYERLQRQRRPESDSDSLDAWAGEQIILPSDRLEGQRSSDISSQAQAREALEGFLTTAEI